MRQEEKKKFGLLPYEVKSARSRQGAVGFGSIMFFGEFNKGIISQIDRH